MAARRAKRTEHRAEMRRLKRSVSHCRLKPQGGCREGGGIQGVPRSTNPEPGRGSQHSMYDEAEIRAEPSRMATHKVSYGQGFKIATLNLTSLIKATMHKQIEAYMEERDIALLCIQETKVAQTTHYVVGDLLYVLHGHGGPGQEYAGVGMVIRKDLRKFVSGYDIAAEGRIIVARVDLAPRGLSIISAYAPQSNRPEAERVAFYDELNEVMAKCQKKGATLIAGDLNARIHGRRLDESEILGPHLYGYGYERVVSQVWAENNGKPIANCSWSYAWPVGRRL